jgi:alkaline phosphatase D
MGISRSDAGRQVKAAGRSKKGNRAEEIPILLDELLNSTLIPCMDRLQQIVSRVLHGLPCAFTLFSASFLGASDMDVIAFGSCAGQNSPQPIWEEVLEVQPDLWIWAGDTVYGDTEDMDKLRADYAKLSAIPGYQALLETGIPVLGTWDDHDYGVNDGDATYPMRKESQQVFLDFYGVEDDSPRRQREGVYHAEIFGSEGRRVQVILLDTRYHRSALTTYPDTDEGRWGGYRPDGSREASLLGEEQWQWLEAQLKQPAELRLLVSSIQVLSGEHRWEKWSNFPRERQRLLRLIESTKAGGLIVLSGDRHHAELSRKINDTPYPIFDLTASGINKSNRPKRLRQPEENRYRMGDLYRGHHFGLVEVDWSQPDPLVRLSIIDSEGTRPVEHTVQLSELSETPGTALQLQEHRESPGEPPFIAMDGHFTDWLGGELMVGRGNELFLRFAVPEERSLTKGSSSLHLLLDADGADSGQSRFGVSGVDFEIVFAPRRERGDRGWRPIAYGYLPQKETLGLDAVGLNFAPTHASRWFEVRLDREAMAAAGARFGEAGSVRFSLHESEASGANRMLARGAVEVGAVRSIPRPTVDLPGKPENGLRIVCLNTLWGSPLADAEPFARVFRALDADIYLIQEWSRERVAVQEVTRWFEQHIDDSVDWECAVSGIAGSWSGTLIVSRYPLRGALPRYVPVEGGGWDFPARFATALIDTPVGVVLAASAHLKSAGSIGSREDQRRLAEADAMNHILYGIEAATQPDMVVFGGDFNLVGSPDILDRALRLLDSDGSALTVAEAALLGYPQGFSTHGRGYPGSRLDFVAFSDTSADLASAFVLNTTLLAPDSLDAAGLKAEDSTASDHLPIVVDLLPVAFGE